MSEPVASPPSKTFQGTSLRVLWTVTSYHIGNNATWGEHEAKAMLFKPLDMNSTTLTFDGQTCSDVVFSSEIFDTDEYLMNRYQVNPRSLGLEDEKVEVLKTNCDIQGFDEYVRLRDRSLLVHINGVLFVFSPAVNY